MIEIPDLDGLDHSTSVDQLNRLQEKQRKVYDMSGESFELDQSHYGILRVLSYGKDEFIKTETVEAQAPREVYQDDSLKESLTDNKGDDFTQLTDFKFGKSDLQINTDHKFGAPLKSPDNLAVDSRGFKFGAPIENVVPVKSLTHLTGHGTPAGNFAASALAGTAASTIHPGTSRTTDLKTPAEYTLHIIFTQFVRHSERKLNSCLEFPLNEEPPIIDLLSEGIDTQFDKIISSLGYIARRKPKPVIDSVMFWRKSKSEVAAMANLEVERISSFAKTTIQKSPASKRSISLMRTRSFSKASHKRNQSASSVVSDFYYDEQVNQARETAIQADRKSLALIYILCRVLIEVVKQTENMNDDLQDKLEEIVYTQLKATDPVTTSQSLVRSANWNLFTELLGYMSEKNFLSVTDRFIADLEKVPVNLKLEEEPKLHLLIHGMRHLKLTNYPLETFEESAEFIQSLAKFFNKSQNETIIFAYCEILSSLMLPLANILTAETNHPTWVEGVEMIFQKAYQIWNRAIKAPPGTNSQVPSSKATTYTVNTHDDWSYSLHLITSVLSVSRKELFSEYWFKMIENNSFKLKPKVEVEDKTTYIVCMARLVWVYIYRLPDSLNNTIKRLDSLFEVLFAAANKKQVWLTSDTFLINATVELLRIVGFHHLNYILDNVMIRVLKFSFNGYSMENLSPERVIVVIKSYLVILEDFEKAEKPTFPTDEAFGNSEPKPYSEYKFLAKNTNNAVSHEEICRTFAGLLKLLDTTYGCDVDSKEVLTTKSSGLFNFGIDFTFQQTKDLHMELFGTLIDAIPWTMVPLPKEATSPSGIPFQNVVEILTRNSVHSNKRVALASIHSLQKLASRKNPSSLITLFAKIAFRFSDKPGPTYNSDYINSAEFGKLLKIYVDLLHCWLMQFKEVTKTPEDDDQDMAQDVLNDLYQIKEKAATTPSDELEWKTIITVIEEIEGNGLFFLCSQDSKTRHYGVAILKLVEQFDLAILKLEHVEVEESKNKEDSDKSHSRSSSKYTADAGTRLIHVLDDVDFVELIKPYRKYLSVPERTRLAKLKNKKNILVKLAESDYGIDSTIWFRLYPKLLDIFFERCPMPVAMCRSIVCVRMVQMHELVLEFSESYKNYTSSLFSRSSGSPPELLVNQWKLYLIFACCSLTSTNDQKISFPTQPTHGRKRLMQMFIQHQKITSAKSVFRMVIPLLKLQQPMVRDSVISGLSCININIFRTFIECIPASLNDWKLRDLNEDRLRIEIVHILSNITDRFKKGIYNDEWAVANLVSIVKNVKMFLSVGLTQEDIEFQRLRRYFSGLLENVFLGLQSNLILDKWLPFEARLSCFNYLKEWCGDEITEDRYTAMKLKVANMKDKTSTEAILEMEKKLLQFSTLSCMAVLCSAPIVQRIEIGKTGKVAIMSFDIPAVMAWIRTLFASEIERISDLGKAALKNILELNLSNEEIYQAVIKECYQGTESYFKIFVDSYLESASSSTVEAPPLPLDIICLASFLLGHKSDEVRSASLKLLKYYTELNTFTSNTLALYKRTLKEITIHLTTLHPPFVPISYLTKYFHLVSTSTQTDILSCLLPWVQKVTLEGSNSQNSTMVLNNLFEITVKVGQVNSVESLWIALGNAAPGNFAIIIDYIMNICLQHKNATFLEYSRQIIDYLAFSQPDVFIDKFVQFLQPKSMVPLQSVSILDSGDLPYYANLWRVIPSTDKDAAFSLGQLSMVFLVDLYTIRSERMLEKLPLLLHVAFSLLDHYLVIVQEQARALLIHLIQSLAPKETKSAEAIDILNQRDYLKYLWVYDDLNNDKKGGRTPKNMDLLVRNVLQIFEGICPTLQDEWSRVSLTWATTCAVRHIACRSFQIFRSLLTFLDQGMLKDMLHRLSNTISDETVDIQGFAMQILMTLNAVTAELNSDKLIDFPQLFWLSVACLSTVHEQEFIEVLSTMSKFVLKIDLDAPDTVSCLISTFPPKWEGKFEGLQQVVLVGLRSSSSWEISLKFLDKLNTFKDSEIIGMGLPRLLMSLLSNLPRFLRALDQKVVTKEIEDCAMLLSVLCSNNGQENLSRILVSLAKNRFRSKKDFLAQTVATIKNAFFPEFEAQTLVFLLGFLSNKIPWVKLETMLLLKQVFPLVDLQREEFVGVGADLISPLLRLLLTDYAEPALEVLDEAAVILGSLIDKDVLRMSLGNTAMQREFEKTATLFGVPNDNGWAIPMPAVTAALTRNNIHAVFSTCVVPLVEETPKAVEEEEIQFHMEDYYAGDQVSVTVDEPDALSHVWAALDDFDSFFTKDENLVTHNVHQHSALVDTANSDAAQMDLAPLVYDKKASVILTRSLARTQSNASFKTNFADSMGMTDSNLKRLYIPFRNSRNIKKNETLTTPIMPQNAFDLVTPPQTLNPFKTPNSSHATLASPNFSELSQTNLLGFEHFKKKSKKKSPGTTSGGASPEVHSWNQSPTESPPGLSGKVKKKYRQVQQ